MFSDPSLAKLRDHQYARRLEPREIRLLHFESRKSKRDPIRLRTSACKLPTPDAPPAEKPRPYLTLSYAWGESLKRREILVDGDYFSIGDNLRLALDNLEDHVGDKEIWIDAISINQSDQAEKGAQVSRMRDVYHNSQCTIVWLGAGDSSLERTMRRADSLGREAFGAGILEVEYTTVFNYQDGKRTENVDVDECEISAAKRALELVGAVQNGDLEFENSDWRELGKISNLPWFYRVWVLQEYALSRSVEFVYGRAVVAAKHFMAAYRLARIWYATELRMWKDSTSISSAAWTALHLVRRNGWGVLQNVGESLVDKPWINLQAASTLTDVSHDDPKYTLAEQLLWCYAHPNRALRTSEPKDRIYALLGVSKDVKYLDITPQYSQAVPYYEVYAHVCKRLIQRGHLVLLSLRQWHPWRGYSMDSSIGPSWMVDWSKPVRTPWADWECGTPLFSASGAVAFCQISVEGNDVGPYEIRMEAFYTGTISETCHINESYREQYLIHPLLKIIETVNMFLNRENPVYNRALKEEARWKIPIGDTERNENLVTVRATEKSRLQYEGLAGKGNAETILASVENFSYTTHLKYEDGNLFMTDTGYIGWCPKTAQVGDQIWIPLGSQTPHTFRPSASGRHTLLGETYAFGIMDGELLASGAECNIITVE